MGLLAVGAIALLGPVVAPAVSGGPPAQAVVSEDEGGGEAPAAEPEAADTPAAVPSPEAPEASPEESSADEAASEAPVEDAPDDSEPTVAQPTKAKKATGDDPDDADAGDEPSSDDGADDSVDGALDDEAVDDESLNDEAVDDEAVDDEATEEEVIDGEAVEEEVIDDAAADEGAAASGELVLDIAEGDGIEVVVEGSGLMPRSRVEVWVFSTPRLVTTGSADDAGDVSLAATLPADLPEGPHTVLLKGTDADGQPIELGDGIEVGANGELLGLVEGVDVAGLVTPALPSDPMAPPYPTVVALDDPTAVVSTTIGAFALIAVASATAGMAGGALRQGSAAGAASGSGVVGGGINEGLYWGETALDEVDVEHNRGWRTRFAARGSARGDRSFLHRAPLTSVVDEASHRWMLATGPLSPLLSRMIGDGAPLRAMLGSLSLTVPLAAVIVAVAAAIGADGIAQPPALGLVMVLMALGIVDAFAGGLAAIAFTVTVALMGGIVDWSSVRTLLGIAMLIIGPGIIAGSFRDIRRAAPRTIAGWWERVADLVIAPLVAAYTTFNIVSALPPLGGALFPIGDAATMLAWFAAGMVIVKILLEDAGTRWFPERMATVLAEPDWPATPQRLASAVLRVALFLFISAAFIGSPWQLWVAGALFVIPFLLEPFSESWPNLPRLWQWLPQSLPYMALSLVIYLLLASRLYDAYPDEVQFALMSFVILLVPEFILQILWLFGREPAAGDVRWYLRPSMVGVYRVGGVLVLAAAIWLAYRSLF